jgi:hypothetical protein
MCYQTTATNTANSTRTVNFPNNALPGITSGTRYPDKFMPRYSPKAHVAPTQLQIRFTDAGFEHIHGNFVGPGFAELGRRSESQLTVKNNCSQDFAPKMDRADSPETPAPRKCNKKQIPLRENTRPLMRQRPETQGHPSSSAALR